MSDPYLSITLGGKDRNVEAIGTYVAWLIANDLLDPVFVAKAGSAVTRVRMQDFNGAEFLTTVMHGELRPEQLSSQAREFTERYVMSGDFERELQSVAYEGEDEWARFDAVSPKITAAWRNFSQPPSALKSLGAKILKFPSRKS